MARELIVEIPYSPQEYQLEIHNNPARFKVIIIGRRGGKTEFALNETIKRAMDKVGNYWFIAPTYRQAKMIAWGRLKHLVAQDTFWKFNEVELYAFHTLRKTGIHLKGADNEETLKGVGLDGVVLDECALMRPEIWQEVVRPMLADTKGWGIFISTPKGHNWLYDLYLKNETDWKIWKYPTSINKYISPEELEQAKKDMPERLYRQEFLAEFLDDETSVFRKVRQCVCGELKEPIIGRFYVMGVDLAKTQDWTVLMVMDAVTREVVAFERFQDISWTEQKIRIHKLATKYNNALTIIDASGVGDPIVEDLSQSGLSIYYDGDKPGFRFTNINKAQLIEQAVISIEQRLITFPRIDVLLEELMQFEYIFENGKVKYSAPEGKHDDCVIALALAIWAIRSSLHEAQQLIKDENELDRQGQGERISEREEDVVISGY